MRRPFLLPLAALLVPACGHSPATRFLTLDPVPPAAAVVRADYRGPPVALTGVRLPVAVDRVEVVRELGAGRVAVSDSDRWIAPPGSLIRDALVRDLTARLPEGSVLPPAAVPAPGATRVEVTVLAFDPAAATLQLVFRIMPARSAPLQRVVSLSSPGGGADAAAGAGAVSAMLGQLSDRIVAELPAGR